MDISIITVITVLIMGILITAVTIPSITTMSQHSFLAQSILITDTITATAVSQHLHDNYY